ncbi:MAG: hypothetical protein AAF907_05970, partial [Planctomycetota bacterium]
QNVGSPLQPAGSTAGAEPGEESRSAPAGESDDEPQATAEGPSDPLERDDTFVLAQRARRALPNTNERLFLRIGDVTGGQVRVMLEDIDGAILWPPRSVRSGDSLPVVLGWEVFDLSLVRLNNNLIGQDFASFTLRPRTVSDQENATATTADAAGRHGRSADSVEPPARAE